MRNNHLKFLWCAVALFVNILVGGCSGPCVPLYQPLEDQNSNNPHTLKFSVHGDDGRYDRYLVFHLQKELDKRTPVLSQLCHKNTTIHVHVTEDRGGIATNHEGISSRYISQLEAKISTNHNPKKFVYVDTTTSYNVETTHEFSIQSTQTSARDRLVQNVAEKIQQTAILLLRSQS